MTDDGEDVVVDRLPPDEAFDLVAHETRLRTLRVLNEADAPLSFSELRERVGAEDPGGFNYHLGKLTGGFVREIDDDAAVVGGAPGRDEGGYALAPAGRRVVGAVLSGGVTKGLSGDPVVMDSACLNCGTPMEARFMPDGLQITCPDCGVDYTHADVPPGVLEGRSRASAPAIVDRWLMRNHASAEYGFCYNCDGQMDVTVRATEHDEPEAEDESSGESGVPGTTADAIYECQRCGHGWHSSLPLALLTKPAVVGFHHRQGVDLRETPAWELDWLEPGMATVASRDPLRVAVRMTVDGETLEVVVDETLAVVEDRRE